MILPCARSQNAFAVCRLYVVVLRYYIFNMLFVFRLFVVLDWVQCAELWCKFLVDQFRLKCIQTRVLVCAIFVQNSAFTYKL